MRSVTCELMIALPAVLIAASPQLAIAFRGEPVSQKPALKLPLNNPRIVVYKQRRQLDLYSNNVVVRTYRVGLGFNPKDDKIKEGDGCTPEGEFYVFVKNSKSAYHLSLGVSYPNVENAHRGLRDRLISKEQHDAIVKAIQEGKTPPQYTPLGGLIYIHGNGASKDWTLGCVALENEDIEELFNAVTVGTPIIIKP
jgi:murein L,D-transpeptidase YafK